MVKKNSKQLYTDIIETTFFLSYVLYISFTFFSPSLSFLSPFFSCPKAYTYHVTKFLSLLQLKNPQFL